MSAMVGKLLFLQPGEFRRLLPFFGLYMVLFAALTLADGLALTLFVEHLGAGNLPITYGIIAVLNLAVMGIYLVGAERAGSRRTFQCILLSSVGVFAVSWAALRLLGGGPFWIGFMFVSREISFTLFLMHFGTYLQDYFSRAELNRVLPIVYSGGRVGGIAGGWLLENLSGPLGLVNLSLVFVLLGLAGMGLVQWISRRLTEFHAPEDDHGDPGTVPGTHASTGPAQGRSMESEAAASMAGFLRYVWASPLLFWTTVTSILFMICRWVLNYQYSAFFAGYFPTELTLASFLGSYTQIALGLSLVIQLVVVNRLVAWIGLRGTHLVYSLLLVGGVAMNLFPMTLGMAVFARLVETELRFGLRNPITQMISNKFSKCLRVRVRAWSMGVLNPAATLISSVVLGGLLKTQVPGGIPWLGGLAGLFYFLGTLGLYGALRDLKVEKPAVGDPHSWPDLLNRSAAVHSANTQTDPGHFDRSWHPAGLRA